MAWRFKASKYKNAAPIVPKPEQCIRDICVGSYQTYGNNIAASAAFMAFNWEHAGSSLAVLPIDDCGRKSKTMPLLHGHTDTVTDLEFSPFHDGLLATGSQDCLVKIWHIPEKGLESSLTDPECTFHHKQRRVERVGFHPTADCLLYSTSAGNISLWDITTQQEAFSNNEHPEVIQSLSWKQDGTVLATSCKDKIVRIIDPRATESPITMSADNHASIKDSRIVWLGNQNRILTTGFDSARLRQVIVRDLRNFSTPEKTLELDCSTGILMPLYDPDTNMLFLAGKGDITITYLEITDKEPYFVEGLRHSGEQTKGACLVPKRALRVMEGEVNRVLQLTSNTVIPIMYQVPRKTYRDFHSDLYPDTNGCKTDLTASQWLGGNNVLVNKISLDPAKRALGDQPIVILRGNLQEVVKNIQNKPTKLPIAKTPTIDDMVKPKFVPIKEKIKQMEETNIKADIDKNEFEQKFKELTASHKDMKNNENECLLIENTTAASLQSTPSNENGGGSFEMENNELDGMETYERHQNGNGNGVAPKPLPRTSRTNSVTGDSFEEMLPPSSILAAPRPIARPRTTATSYKPRLGPKPFSSGQSGDFSFDKVFSVPAVPGSDGNGDTNKENVSMESDSPPTSISPVKEKNEEEEAEEDQQQTNGEDHEYEVELREKEIDEALDTVEKIRTTAERRRSSDEEKEQLFESRNEAEDVFDSIDDKTDQFDRLNAQRNSIADRRRMYESRSLSVQEEKPASPTIKRRDSLKQRDRDSNKDDETKRKSIPFDMVRQKSDLTKESVTDSNRIVPTKKETSNITLSKRTSTVFGKVSKFRHLKGTTGHKSTQLENLRNLSRQIPGECDGFHANHERVGVPLSGPGGKIAIYELSKPGRLPDGVIPSLVNGSNIMDFQWDPFNAQRLAVACDDGVVKLWTVPKDGLTEPTNTPAQEFNAHSDKIYFIKFHPLAENVLLTASYDMTIKVWDLDTMTEKLCLTGHTDQIFSLSWSPCGQYCATVCKDGKIRVYNPRKACTPINEGPGPVGTRGARIVWAIEGEYLVVTGFDKVSERQISVYKADNLKKPLGTVGLDVSPAILIPFYDEDSSTLFVTGKGDTTIYAYEITEESPYVCPLSHHRCTSLHQGLSFLFKNQCDVTIVEFAKALRLTNNTVEPLSFTVPRLKNELFQDDLFPHTRVRWQPSMGAQDWFAMKDKKAKRISLQPEGMDSLSSTQPTPTPVKKIDPTQNIDNRSWDKDAVKTKQKEIQKSVSSRMEVNYKLEQDDMEGVDEREWEE